MRVVAYVRVSRVAGREGPSFISPTVQRDQIAAWAKAGNHHIVGWFEDLDQPGTRADRPGLAEAMRAVEDGDASGVAVAKLDRFGRSTAHLGQLVARLHDAGAALFSVAEGVDTRGATGKLIATILVSIGEWEVARITDNWTTARASAAARGVYLAEAPLGFTKDADGRLQPGDDAAIVPVIFRRRSSGESWARIAEWLDGEGVRARRGGTWTVSAVRRLVGNRAYVGEGPGGTRHPPLVSAALFETANVTRGVAPARSGNSSGVLSGILRCAGCRYAMKMQTGKTRHGKPRRDYRCAAAYGAYAGGRCQAPCSVTASVIEPVVLGIFSDWVGDYRAKGVAPDSAIDDAEAVVREAEAELDAVLDQRLVDALGGEDQPSYIAAVQTRREAVDEARGQLVDAVRGAQASALPDVRLGEVWPDLSLYEQRKLLASVFDCVFLRRAGGPAASGVPIADRLHVCFRGEAPDLPIQGQPWTVAPFDFPASAEAVGQDAGEG